MQLIIDKSELIKRLKSLEYESFPKPGGPVTLSLEFFKNSDSLLRYDHCTAQLEITATDEQMCSQVLECLDRAGASYITIQFSPSSKTRVAEVGSDYVKTQAGLTIQKTQRTRSTDWLKWFFDVLSLEGDVTYLIPDTNFLRRHYFSNVFFPLLGEQWVNNLSIKLPRLVLLEIERLYNRHRKGNQNKLDKKEQADRERRLAFSTAEEVLLLKKHGATLLDQIDPSILEGFSKISGDQNTDAWIRREIHNFREHLNLHVGAVAGVPMTTFGSVFLTCDLMNAFAASAEDITTMLFSRSEEATKYHIERDIPQVAELIIAAAVNFGSIRMVANYLDKKEEFTIEGMWSGKTVPDWEKDCVLIH